MSGSGIEDNITNNTNETAFNCRLSETSGSFITNKTHWEIGEDLRIGSTIAGVLVLIFFLIATVWNLFIIITFFVKHSLLKEPANIFLLNVAFTDLIICLTSMIFSFVTAFGQEFVFGSDDITRCAICNMSGFFIIFTVLVSLHLLMALSIDRFILLSRPLRYPNLMNRTRAIIICAIMYVVCFIIAVLPQLSFGEFEFNPRFASCVPRFTPRSNLYYAVFLAGEAMIPIIVLAITNVWTYRLVSKFLKKNFRRKSTYRRRDEKQAKTADGQKHQQQQKQLIKVFSALFLANIVSYTPTILTTFVFLVLSLIGNENIIPAEVYILGFVSFLSSAVLHPIIESFFVKELRYQVNRAKKGVRRVSTNIYRQTTLLFSNKTLDEAAQKADDTSTPTAKRSIRFLNGRVVHGADSTFNDTVVTDMDDMASPAGSASGSPEPTTVVEPDDSSSSTAAAARERRMLESARKSVSFQDYNRLHTSPGNAVRYNNGEASSGGLLQASPPTHEDTPRGGGDISPILKRASSPSAGSHSPKRAVVVQAPEEAEFGAVSAV